MYDPRPIENPNLRELPGLALKLIEWETGGLTLRDVKNEDRSDYVYENTGSDDKMYTQKHGLLQNKVPIAGELTRIERNSWPKCTNYATIGTKADQTVRLAAMFPAPSCSAREINLRYARPE
jgi:hypothetical protein